MKAQHAVFQAANAKGITLIASAGDSGSAAAQHATVHNYVQSRIFASERPTGALESVARS